MALNPTNQRGSVMVRNFSLRDEPALKRVAAVASQADDINYRGTKTNLVADDTEVSFTKMRADVTQTGDLFEISDGVMWGRELGGTIAGSVDYGRDRVNLNGTFVPAYSLNNAFAKIPVFGLFLGGNKNEGLFAIPFQISGKASQPNLTINPIAAASPGFLRKIFDFRSAPAADPVGEDQ
jgi:hypothetical protein